MGLKRLRADLRARRRWKASVGTLRRRFVSLEDFDSWLWGKPPPHLRLWVIWWNAFVPRRWRRERSRRLHPR
jgi:hypothetical protein